MDREYGEYYEANSDKDIWDKGKDCLGYEEEENVKSESLLEMFDENEDSKKHE